jgi:branched-chain amino acid transport system substrate-binding protein
MTRNSFQINRRQLAQTLGAAATLGPFSIGSSQAQAHKGDIVIGAAQLITGVFSFAGVAMNMGLNDYCAWRNSKGGVTGRKLK